MERKRRDLEEEIQELVTEPICNHYLIIDR